MSADSRAMEGDTLTEPESSTLPPASPSHARLSLRQALLYASGNFGAGVYYALNNFVLSAYLPHLGAPPELYGPLSNTDSLEGAVIQPLVGTWSDRTWWKRLGRRRPFIVILVPMSAAFIVLTALAPLGVARGLSLGLGSTAATMLLVSIGVFLFTVTFNIMKDPYVALLADITPTAQRGGINGLSQLIQAGGQMAMLLFGAFLLYGTPAVQVDQKFLVLFLVAAAALVLFFLPTVFGIREPRELVHVSRHTRYHVRDYWHALRGEREVQRYYATQFFLWLGINTMKPFIVPYAMNVIGLNLSQALFLAFVLLASTAVFNWPFGVLADKVGLKRVFLAGMLVIAGASLSGIWVRQPAVMFAILFLAGVGNAAQTASSYPLLTRIVRPDRMGLYTGLNSTITSIAAPGSALIAAVLIHRFGFAVLFPFIAIMFLLTLPPLASLNVAAGEAAARAELAANGTPTPTV
ncbi:MAG TPA: MFS transporter [Ktedonobacterales bacterium]